MQNEELQKILDEHEKLKRKTESIRCDLKAAETLQEVSKLNYWKLKYGLKKGCVVVSESGEEYLFSGFRDPDWWSINDKPLLLVFPKKQGGEWSKIKIGLFFGWKVKNG